jgi:arylformamidase
MADILEAGTEWIDVSVPIHTVMVHWPTDPPIVVERVADIARGDIANVSMLSMGAHTGTHVDAPVHFLPGGKSIDTMPLGATLGRARVIAIADPVAVTADELRPHAIQRGERILFKTRNSATAWRNDTFVEDFVYIAAEAARYLAAQEVQTVGIDYLSVGGFKNDAVETHQALLEAGVWIIEGLNLAAIAPGAYDLICLTLKIVGGDGAPARAILRPVTP